MREFSGEGRVALAPLAPQADEIVVGVRRFDGFSRIRAVAVGGRVYGGTIAERPLGEPPASDLNGDRDDADTLAVVVARARLSLAARKIAYGENIVFSGPTYKNSNIKKGKMIITFDNVGSGLVVKDKYGYVKGFAIAGADKKFVWAKALIENNKIIVWNDKVKNPKYVRYAWADNPDDANLYNVEDLPACPFRTDKNDK